MKRTNLLSALLTLGLLLYSCNPPLSQIKSIKRLFQLRMKNFWLMAQKPTKGVTWQGYPIEGLLMNSRMVQGIFDDLNPET